MPYLISVWLARSSAEAIGVTRRSMVRNAAKLAVYVEIMIRTKNHHTVPIIRPDKDLKRVYSKTTKFHYPLINKMVVLRSCFSLCLEILKA